MTMPYIRTLLEHTLYTYLDNAYKLLSFCILNRAIHVMCRNIYCLAMTCSETRLTTLHLHQVCTSARTAP
jgi:hypothetical protein